MKAHPAADIFPMFVGVELAALAADIRERGQRVPIVTLNGEILDGRNRWKACEMVGVEPRCEEWDGAGGSPTAFVLSLNLRRRHLDESQRAIAGARAKKLFEAEAKVRMLAGTPSPNLGQGDAGKSAEKAAALVNVSRGSVESASKVLTKGAPELVAAVEAGEVAVSTAAVIADAPAEEQRAIVEKAKKDKKAAPAAAKKIKERKPPKATRVVERQEVPGDDIPEVQVDREAEIDLDAEEQALEATAAEMGVEREKAAAREPWKRLRCKACDWTCFYTPAVGACGKCGAGDLAVEVVGTDGTKTPAPEVASPVGAWDRAYTAVMRLAHPERIRLCEAILADAKRAA